MTIVYTDAHLAHNPQFEIYDGQKEPYAEKSARAEVIIEALRREQLGEIVAPDHFPVEHTKAVHQSAYIDFIKSRSDSLKKDEILYPSYFMSDTYAPLTAGTYSASVAAVDAAMTGAERILRGEKSVYSLCRPPGHHAAHHTMGGYCYFNNAAIATERMSKEGRVGILDIDFHHGNGTQDAFYDRDDVLYVSLHADPRDMYPYSSGFADERGRDKGVGYNINYPLPLGTNDEQYMKTLHEALKDIGDFKPDFLIASCGFDTYKDDPIGGFALTVPFYRKMADAIANLQLPTLIVQEGGYNIEHLGDMAVSFLSGFAG